MFLKCLNTSPVSELFSILGKIITGPLKDSWNRKSRSQLFIKDRKFEELFAEHDEKNCVVKQYLKFSVLISFLCLKDKQLVSPILSLSLLK